MTDAKLKILHLEASKGWGGQEIRILTEAQTFLAHGHDVHLVANADSEILANAPRFGVPATAIDLNRKNLSSLRAVRGFLKAHRPDLAVPHSSVDSWMVALARIGLGPRLPIVRARHISAAVPRNPGSRWLYRRGCDRIITTGDLIVEQLTKDGFVQAERIGSIPTGIDTERYRPVADAQARAAIRLMMGLPADVWLYGIVATLRSWKGHADLIDAFATLADTEARLLIVGDGPQLQNIQEQIARLKLEDRVILTGQQRDVVPWLQAMDCFCLPSYANEGVPQAVLQAIASGLPIVSTPVGGIPECTDGVEGVILTPPRNVKALAMAMTAMRNLPPPDPAARHALAVARHSTETMYGSALAAYADAIRAVRGKGS